MIAVTKSRCVKGWSEIGFGRALRSTAGHHLYVIRTMGGRFVAEVLKKHENTPVDVKIFDGENEARLWAEATANVRPANKRPWWHEGA